MADSPSGGTPPVSAPTAQTAIAASPSRFSALFWGLKIVYALSAGVLCVFWLSFFPAPGRPLLHYIPGNAGLVIHVNSGQELLQFLIENPSVQELLKDEDVEHFSEIAKRLSEARQKHAALPKLVRNLYPYLAEGLWPVAGGEMLLARLAPPGHQGRKAEILVLTRLRGARGAFVRIGAWWAQSRGLLNKNVQAFDLGGDVLAAGFNGAQPRTQPAVEARIESAGWDFSAAFASIRLYPEILARARGEPEAGLVESPQMQEFGRRVLPPAVLSALLNPPRAPEMLHFPAPPKMLTLNIFKNGGGLSVRGTLLGPLPALPQSVRPLPVPIRTESGGEEPVIHAEGLLPLNAQAAFLAYVEGNMRLKRDVTRLSRTQDKWAKRFERLYDAGVALDEDLWPALGNALQFSIQQAPVDRSSSGYDLIFASAAFKSDDALARHAAAELARVRWDYLFDGAATKNAPYVRRVRDAESETYILATGKITAPAWQIGGNELLMTSDSGPRAIVDPPSVAKMLMTAERAPALRPDRFFVSLNGPKLASTVEQIYTAQLDGQEEDIGAAEFLQRVPDAQLRIRLVVKLTRLLGEFRAELKPGLTKEAPAEVRIEWTPASLATPEAPEDAVPPPPPAP